MSYFKFHQTTQPFVPLSPLDFHIPLCLMLHRHHAYAIMKRTSFESWGAFEPRTSTVYAGIKRLCQLKLVKLGPREVWLDETKERQYYEITQLGKMVFARHVEWTRRIDKLISERGYIPEEIQP